MPDTLSLALRAMAARPVFHKDLGEFLREKREGKRLGLRQAAALAARRHPSLTKGAIEGIEKGRTRHIAPDLMRGMADLYGLKYEDLVSLYVASEYGLHVAGRDLIRPPSTKLSTLPTGGADRDTPATRERLEELEGKVLVYEAIIATARSLSAQLAAAVGAEGSEGGDPPPRRGGRTRKNR